MPHTRFLFEANLSGERIYQILSQCITNMKMMIAFQQFQKENWDALKRRIAPRDYATLASICEKYLGKQATNPKHECSSVVDIINEQQLTESHLEISVILKILNKYKRASEYCLSMPISIEAKAFIDEMEALKHYMRERINRSAEMEKKYANHLKQLYEQNVNMNDVLQKLQTKIEALESQKKTIQNAKESDLTRHRREIESIRRKFNGRVQEKITVSENQMILDWKSSEFRQATLIEELATQEMYFDNLRKDRLAKEKELRIKRYKIESQLVAVLEKYDTDIGERHRQKEELIAQLEEEKLELEQLQERFDEQEVLYNTLMTEKELHEKRIFDEKIYSIRSRMAARTIQRGFRKYLERRARGKKKGKGKGKGKKK